MIDIGVNLTNARFDKDRGNVIERAKLAKVTDLLVTGTSVAESQKAVDLCQRYGDILSCTVGVHPHDADNVSNHYLTELTSLALQPCVKAIGECGLDFNRNFSTPANQERVFQEQIELAQQLQLPLFLHQRDAFETWFNILKPFITEIPAMVSHCFTGSVAELKYCVDAGMYIGITGWLCDERRGGVLREAVKHLPLDRLMIETDAPYLTPRTIRPRPKSSRNEPAYLPYVVSELAKITGHAEEDIIFHSRRNSQRVFSLSSEHNHA